MNEFCLVYLVIGDETLDLFENSIKSLRVELPKVECMVFHNSRASEKIKKLSHEYVFEALDIDDDEISFESYSEFGTEKFNKITSQKWKILLDVLGKGFNKVVFLDCDVVIIRNFLPYLMNVSKQYNIAIQSESQSSWPPTYCTGFMFFSKNANPMLNRLSSINESNSLRFNDQEVFNKILQNNPSMTKEILLLPDSIFPNGLQYKNFAPAMLDFMAEDKGNKPFIFHANWVRGIDRKIKLLKHVGLWKL
jgi:hypothetical protein